MSASGRIVRQQPMPRTPVAFRPALDHGDDFHEERLHLELNTRLGVAVGTQRPALHDAEDPRLFPSFLQGHLLGGAAALETALGDHQTLVPRPHHADTSATYRNRRRLADQFGHEISSVAEVYWKGRSAFIGYAMWALHISSGFVYIHFLLSSLILN